MKNCLAVLALLMLAIVLISPNARAQNPEEFLLVTDQAVVLDAKGGAQVEVYPSAPWKPIEVGMVLTSQAKIRTEAGAWVEVGFGIGLGNENVVRIQENSFVDLADVKGVKLGLLKGELRSLVQGLDGESTFEIRTPSAVCGARGTGWTTFTDGVKVIVDTFENEVFFYPQTEEGDGESKKKMVKSGKRGLLKDPKSDITIMDIPIEKMEKWKKWKKDFTERTWIKVGLEGKVDKTVKTAKPIQDIVKYKQSTLEKKDLSSIKDRLEDKKRSSDNRREDEWGTDDY